MLRLGSAPLVRAIIRKPICPRCGIEMRLAREVPATPNVEQRIFQCRECHLIESVLVDYKKG